jgi:hypothetical protein
MATVITFPTERLRVADSAERRAGSATIIILPVVRIERHEEPAPESTTAATGRKRRRRSPRS